MSPLESFVTEYLAASAGAYFVRQYLVIFVLFVFGAILTDALMSADVKWYHRALLAFPAGLSAFAVTAYIILVAGIPYGVATVVTSVLIETAAAVYVSKEKYARFVNRQSLKHMLIATVVVLFAGAFATSAIVPVSISNDTMYYFKRYPDAIVYYGKLRADYDFFLTDTGLGIVAVDTLPALFGFGETFGIRELFHINFIAFFAMTVYERSKRYISKKGCIVAAVAVTAVLAVSTPFVILGHWALANMYFMELFFIAAYTVMSDADEKMRISSLMLVALALFRMEGTLFVVWLIICMALYKDVGRHLAASALAPMAVLFSAYSIKIFKQFFIFDNMYHFLSPLKAALIVAAIAGAAVFLGFVQKRLPKIVSDHLPALCLLALLLGNAVLFAYKRDLYIGNLKAFYANLFRQSGWGMLPYFVITLTVMLFIEYMLIYKKTGRMIDAANDFNITLLAGFVLMTIAASFGRGDVLAEAVGDSGNRVLLQIVPLVVLTYAELTIGLPERSQKNQ